MTIVGYYECFLYSADFVNRGVMAGNGVLGYSSMINHIDVFYPGSSFVEYRFSGFEWVSLRMAFVQEDGQWFLVGLVK